MPGTVCEVCEQFAATSDPRDIAAAGGKKLCGNCLRLDPAQRAKVHTAALAMAKVRPADHVALIAELQQENAQLKADNEKLKEDQEKLKEAPEPKQHSTTEKLHG